MQLGWSPAPSIQQTARQDLGHHLVPGSLLIVPVGLSFWGVPGVWLLLSPCSQHPGEVGYDLSTADACASSDQLPTNVLGSASPRVAIPPPLLPYSLTCAMFGSPAGTGVPGICLGLYPQH